MDAELETIGGNAVLRFERRFAHSVEKVWRAVTDPAEMAHWFPAAVETELKTGAKMRFVFGEQAPVDDKVTDGEILEYTPPKVYAFRWNTDVLRFELVPDGDGCVLYFSQTLGGGAAGRLAAGRNAVGWDTCLAALTGNLAGHPAPPSADWLAGMQSYLEKFGLDQGEITDDGIHFARDLVWQPVERAWAGLTGGEATEPGRTPPAAATTAAVTAGPITVAEAPRMLEYAWLHNGEPAGTVRWEFVSDGTLGVRVELAQTIPDRLAAARDTALTAWRAHLDEFVTGLFAGKSAGKA